MAVIVTRKLSDGARLSAWPLSRDIGISSGWGDIASGAVPFERLFLPKASLQVVHAEMEQQGHTEFEPDEEGDFEVDPDKRYKVKTYNGTITKSAGRRAIPDPDPIPPDYVRQFEFLARDTTDNRVFTYALTYSNNPDEDNPDGWTLTEEGERETGDIYVFSTGAISDEPEPNEDENETTSGTEKKEVGTLTGVITCELSDPVTISDLRNYCDAKLSDLKGRADEESEGDEGPQPVNFDLEVDSYQTDTLKLRMASARMVWQGSGMFSPLPGTLVTFTATMKPSREVNSGSWGLTVSGVIPASEKYYDARGHYGESTWWDNSFSDFVDSAAGVLVTPNDGMYPASGIPPSNLHSTAKYRWLSLDGRKRRIKVWHSFESSGGESTHDTETLTTSPSDGFAQVTSWLEVTTDPVFSGARVVESTIINEEGADIVEFSEDDDIFETSYSNVRAIYRARESNRWGFVGFSSRIPGWDIDDELPDVRYSTVSLHSASLEFSYREPTGTTPSGIGQSSTASASGSYTLTKPEDWALGSLEASKRFSKTSLTDASPFKLEWNTCGYVGEKELTVISENSDQVSLPSGILAGFGDQISVTETEYQVEVDEPPTESRPLRQYRVKWDRSVKSAPPKPETKKVTFSLPAAAEDSTQQVSPWVDISIPEAGKAIWTETANEFTCYVGE